MRPALSRSVSVFRVLALAYAAVLIAVDTDDYARPSLAWVALAVMAMWTALTAVAYERFDPWPKVLLGLDVAVSVGLVLVTLAVATTANIDAGAPTVPAAWSAAAVLMAAIAGGPWVGGLAGAAVSVADIVVRGTVTHHTFNGVVLLLLAGGVGGYVVRLTERAEAAAEAAAAREAATLERDRLAREIHDSTLQVLALVARQGAEIGGDAAALAQLAREQEISLRRLVTDRPRSDGRGAVELFAMVSALASERVTVAGPGQPIWLASERAAAVGAALREALTNVDRHVGAEASAWVLVEADEDDVIVSVRDDGPGVSAARLADAAASGRLGVAQSIIGRVEGVGGTAVVVSGPGRGTEVEIRVPR